MPKVTIRVELARCTAERDSRLETWAFAFQRSRRSAFVRPEHMPQADCEAAWTFAWFEVERDGQVWRGLRRMATKHGAEVWTPDSPAHAEAGGSTLRLGRRPSTGT